MSGGREKRQKNRETRGRNVRVGRSGVCVYIQDVKTSIGFFCDLCTLEETWSWFGHAMEVSVKVCLTATCIFLQVHLALIKALNR